MTTGNSSFHFNFLGQNLQLLSQKAIFWENERTLIIADLHLGKVEHFRKAGIAIPGILAQKDYEVLNEIIKLYPVHTVIILGDLFHSTFNQGWAIFSAWLQNHASLHFILVRGNHDILPDNLYELNHMKVYNDHLIKNPFIFSHVPIDKDTNLYNLAGHIHPSVKLTGKGKQEVILPCFYFGKSKGILPAFGSFTGKGRILIESGDSIFVVFNNQVIPLLDN